jgi:hypothetical protein
VVGETQILRLSLLLGVKLGEQLTKDKDLLPKRRGYKVGQANFIPSPFFVSFSVGNTTARVIISSINDLDRLGDLILKCYETEASKH